MKREIRTKKIDDYSSLTTTIINNSTDNIIFQLIKPDFTILDEKYIPATLFSNEEKKYAVKINYLVPGTYRIRAIIDIDKNGKWTTGNLENKILPEPVIIFPVDQVLRANWENEIEWEIK